ncbi:hypothetical protein RND71_016489 [Anisodus tanguticus]|uniref:Uncharacterized protein n=1 Tax=Anisodus tanguticus TaxID=243964 RepID=A0AAE1S8F9_9SOLA|nr:hypothetical protein RND71_016489 [Anisodus tanguticus]
MMQVPFFNPQQLIILNPLFFPWQPQPVQLSHLSPPFPNHVSVPQNPILIPNPPPAQNPVHIPVPAPLPPPNQEEIEIVEEEELPIHRNSFIKITTLWGAALMIFPDREDKQYIHKCPVTLKKMLPGSETSHESSTSQICSGHDSNHENISTP